MIHQHPCRRCRSKWLDPRDPAYSCDECNKPEAYDRYIDDEIDRQRDDEMIERKRK